MFLSRETSLIRSLCRSYSKIQNGLLRRCDPLHVNERFELKNGLIQNRLASLGFGAKILTKDDRRDFMAIFPDIVRELTEMERPNPELSNLFTKVLQYNVPGGKKMRGCTVVFSYRLLAPPDQLNENSIRVAQILGWCIEMLQAFFVVTDDILDGGETRRGRPCWYKLPDVGLRALTDALLIEGGIYKLLKNHLSGTPCYIPITELFHDITLKTSFGQTIDYNTTRFSDDVQSRINMNRYNYITVNKTSYYTFHLPVAVAMYYAGIYDKEMHRQAKSVLLAMGHYFQVQDDFLDVFGQEGLTGKKGTDIQDGKCTWLAAVALQRVSDKQLEIFKDNFGKPDESNANAIKQLYIDLGLPGLYNIYEEDTYNLITTQIQQLSAGLPHDLFFGLLEKIYKRDK